MVGQLIGTGIELTIGQHGFAKNHCGGLRLLCRLLFNPCGDTGILDIGKFGCVPFDQQLLALSRRQQRQRVDRLQRMGHNGVEQGLEMADHALHGCRVKEIGTVEKSGCQLVVVFCHAQSQFKIVAGPDLLFVCWQRSLSLPEEGNLGR